MMSTSGEARGSLRRCGALVCALETKELAAGMWMGMGCWGFLRVSSSTVLSLSFFFSKEKREFYSVKAVGRRAWGEVSEAWACSGRGGASGMGGRHGRRSWEAAVCAGES